MFKTRVCELLNIKYPVLQGGMAWISTAELAAAVSNAGGLGIIAAGNAPADVLENEIKKVKQLTQKPYGVNVMLLSPYIDEIMEVVFKEKVPVITTGAGNPGKYMKKLKEIGTKVVPVVPSVALAKRMETLGADAVIVEGTEAGGHIGELTTFTLVPHVSRRLTIPLIAAGGIVNGDGFVAALALGAEGVQMGTRFICSQECVAHKNYKEAVIQAKDRDAIVTARSTGHPVRVLKNPFSRELLKLEKEGRSKEELLKFGTGKLKLAVEDGDIVNGSVMIGQVAGEICDIKTCEEIITDIINEASNRIKNMSNFV
ncbi:enoyl-[acyl-carrier-protein] reductase FabK [Serpentinicella sp. ANB-PHB4]|uniref:enoyl-[acyl-carrier-protein] reductase FabK n=1 Tax=Serpentinicella sp. ANB-PHB4 TaxID=3074076 RepID=UPI0028593DC4|nr:enoyl-[acyl-carrier-protein] reductase FabK [Serpentinicella sp. ANB-PHB4]MDR5658297.1 enoyl-[acyl-carrier-protein] reductase FabK [Serpentinicella sp. ANB-PHB4]